MSTTHSVLWAWVLLALGICTSAQRLLVELEPVEVICSGSVVSTFIQTRVKTVSSQSAHHASTASASTNVFSSQPSRGSHVGALPTSHTTFDTSFTSPSSSVLFMQGESSSTCRYAISTADLVSTASGEVPGTSTVPANGTTPGTVVVTQPQPPASTVTSTVTGEVPGTSTVPANGTTPGTVVVTQPQPPASTVTSLRSSTSQSSSSSSVPSTTPVTSTSPSVSTCNVPTTTQTFQASGTVGASSTVAVPACATAARFTVVGGAGGATVSSAAGYGRLISGVIPVTPGQIIRAIAGGSGGLDTQGFSAYGNGGRGGANSGGGGAASALYLDSDLVVVAGGGGGQGGAVSSSGQVAAGAYRYPGDANNGTAGTVGKTRTQTNASGGVLSTARGGQPGTNSAPGTGGTASGYSDAAVGGNSGNGHDGGDYAVTSNTDLVYTSGAGGGGYFGGGSGASSYWLASGVRSAISGGGGGGSSFVSGDVSNSTQYPSGLIVGEVLISFF